MLDVLGQKAADAGNGIGGQFESAAGQTVQTGEIGLVGRRRRPRPAASAIWPPVANALSQRDDRPRCGQVLRPDLYGGTGSAPVCGPISISTEHPSARKRCARLSAKLHRLAGNGRRQY